MPAIDAVLAVATATLAVATWVVPPVNYVLSFRRKPKSSQVVVPSLAIVGRVIGLVVLAACLSVVTLVLAILTLAFSDRTAWGWFGLSAIGVYWFAFATFLVVSEHVARRRQREIGRETDQP